MGIANISICSISSYVTLFYISTHSILIVYLYSYYYLSYILYIIDYYCYSYVFYSSILFVYIVYCYCYYLYLSHIINGRLYITSLYFITTIFGTSVFPYSLYIGTSSSQSIYSMIHCINGHLTQRFNTGTLQRWNA